MLERLGTGCSRHPCCSGADCFLAMQVHNRRRCPSNGKDCGCFTGGEINTVGNILSFRQSSGTNNASREKDGDAENVKG